MIEFNDAQDIEFADNVLPATGVCTKSRTDGPSSYTANTVIPADC